MGAFQYDLAVEAHSVELTALSRDVVVPFDFKDESIAGVGDTLSEGLFSTVRFAIVPQGAMKSGWQVEVSPPSATTKPGGTVNGQIVISVEPAASDPYLEFALQANIRAPDGSQHQVNVTISAYGLPVVNFDLSPPPGPQMQPGDIETLGFDIYNNGLIAREFRIDVLRAPCGLNVVAPSNVIVREKTREEYFVSIEAPDDKPLYRSESCTVELSVYPSDRPDHSQRIMVAVIVDGWYFDPLWAFWAAGITLAVMAFVLGARHLQARYVEEIIGKPQKPWTIPVEAVYLRHLKEKDERAWYMVRHHLMEEEYRSALLWYEDYKHSAKGQLKKERLVVRQERRFDAWKARWQGKLELPDRRLATYRARLQKRLDRKAKKRHKKIARKESKVAAKMRKSYEARVAKAEEKYSKAAAKAAKKGLPAPEAPVIDPPDYPEVPPMEPIRLDEHKWRRKADRMAKKMAKWRGDLEVRFEKKEARKLQKMRRRVRNLARKIDDPDFVKDHPLLGETE